MFIELYVGEIFPQVQPTFWKGCMSSPHISKETKKMMMRSKEYLGNKENMSMTFDIATR